MATDGQGRCVALDPRLTLKDLVEMGVTKVTVSRPGKLGDPACWAVSIKPAKPVVRGPVQAPRPGQWVRHGSTWRYEPHGQLGEITRAGPARYVVRTYHPTGNVVQGQPERVAREIARLSLALAKVTFIDRAAWGHP